MIGRTPQTSCQSPEITCTSWSSNEDATLSFYLTTKLPYPGTFVIRSGRTYSCQRSLLSSEIMSLIQIHADSF